MSTTNETDAGITVHAEQLSDLRTLATSLANLFGKTGAVVVIGDNEGCNIGFNGLKPYQVQQIADALMDVAGHYGRTVVAEYTLEHPEFDISKCEGSDDLPTELADLLGRPAPLVELTEEGIAVLSELADVISEDAE